MMKLAITTVTGIVIAAAAGILSAPIASTAPEEQDAAGVIRQLEAEGFTVKVDRVGSGALDQCNVVGVPRNPQTITRTDRSAPGSNDHRATTIISKTISLTLDCT